MSRKKLKPQFMITYVCPRCHLDSGRTELDPPPCFICERGDGLIEIKREPMSKEVLFHRIKICADRMVDNLRQAYSIAKEEWPENDEEELMLLEALAMGGDLKEELAKMVKS